MNLIYYVKAHETFLFRDSSTSTTATCGRKPTSSDLRAGIDPSVITKAAPMLQYALREVFKYETKNTKITATIYLAKGTHFFFTCNS